MAKHFSDELEIRFHIENGFYPDEIFMAGIEYNREHNTGITNDEVFALVQALMDEVWEKYREEKRREAQEAAFHAAEKDNPFSFTDRDKEILEHLERQQEEQPLTVPDDYDYTGEQMELCFA